MAAYRIRIALAALCLVFSSCGASETAGPAAGSTLPAAPEVDEEIRTSPSEFDDDLVHLVVTPTTTAGDNTAAADNTATGSDVPADSDSEAMDDHGESGVADATADHAVSDAAVSDAADGETQDGETDGEAGRRWSLSPEQIALVPSDAVLEFRDDVPGYVNTLGDFVALDRESSSASSTNSEMVEEEQPDNEDEADVDDDSDEGEAHAPTGDPVLDGLWALPGVEAAMAIGDGSYSVALEDPSVLDPNDYVYVEDMVLGLSAEPYEPYQWALNNSGTNLDGALSSPPAQTEGADIDGVEAAELATGRGVVVAVIDSGVDFSHPDLSGSSWINEGETCGNGIDDDGNGFVDDCTGWDFGYNDNTPYNPGADAHGTHVAGIITANVNGEGIAGIAHRADVMDLNVGGPGGISGSSIAGAVRYAADNGADIINMSLGTQIGTPRIGVKVIEDAVVYALDKGVLVVVAAGNDGVNLDQSPVYPASFALEGMLVVGASAPSDTRASFSNYSPNQVNAFAPGHYILSTVPGADYRFMSGTSQASPLTAGAAALVLQQYPDFTATQIIDQLSSSANVLDSLQTLSSDGARINALNAVAGTVPEVISEEPTDLSIEVSGLVSSSNDVAAAVDVVMPDDWFDEAFHWELTLLVTNEAGTFAVANQPMQIAGASVTTSARGAVRLGDGGPLEAASVAAGLPDGTYSFLIEAIADVDDSIRLGGAHIVTFSVAVAASQPPTTVAPDSSGSGSGSGGGGSTGSGGGGSGSGSSGSGSSGGGSGSSGSGSTGSGSTTTTTAPSDDAGSEDGSGSGSETGGSDSGGSDSGSGSDGSGSTGGGSTGGDGTSGGGSSGGGSTDSGSNDGGTGESGGSGTPAPNTPEVGTDQGSEGEWSVSRFSSQVGYVGFTNVLYIMGSFPSEPFVWFGDQAGTVTYYSPGFIIVETPAQATAGIVDVTLRRSGLGTVLTLPGAYGFQDVGGQDASGGSGGTDTGSGTDSGGTDSGSGSTGSGGTSDGGGTDSGSTGSGSTGSGSSGGSGSGGSGSGGGSTPGTTTPSTPDSSGESTTTTVEDAPQANPRGRQSRASYGEAIDLGNGLTGAPVVGDNPAAGVSQCATDPCAVTSK